MATNSIINLGTDEFGRLVQAQGQGVANGFTDAKYPNTGGLLGNSLVSDGTDFQSQSSPILIKTSAIDLLTIAVSTLFTPAGNFAITGLIPITETLTGTPNMDGNYNIGFTPADYRDIAFESQTYASIVGYLTLQLGFATQYPFIPAGTPLKINVTSADSGASALTVSFGILGYYL